MKYPNKFELYDRIYRHPYEQNVKVTYNEQTEEYEFDYLNGTVVSYDEETVTRLVECFYDIILPEPDLVLPITVQCADSGNIYLISQGSIEDHVTGYNKQGCGYYPNLWTTTQCKNFIKNGLWIVLNVGDFNYELSDAEGSYNPPAEEPSQKPSSTPTSDEDTVKLSVDSSDIKLATERLNALAEAAGYAASAMKELKKVIESINCPEDIVVEIGPNYSQFDLDGYE